MLKKIVTNSLSNRKKIKLSNTLTVLIVFISLFILFSLINKQFISYYNIRCMLNNMVVAGIIALGLTPLMISGGIDISFGPSVALTTVVMAQLYNAGANLWVSLLIGVIVAVIIGFINGILIESFNLTPLLLTLGTLGVLQGLALVLSNSKTVGILTDELYFFSTTNFLRIPPPVWIFIVLILICWIIMNYTKSGMWIRAIGGDTESSRLFGIPVKKVRIILYAFTGLSVGIASIMYISFTGVAVPFYGPNLTLVTLSSILVGGISLTGGSGSVWGTVIGILIMGIVFNALSVFNLPSNYIQICQGVILITVVASYEVKKNKK